MGSEEEKRFQLSYFLFFVSSGRLDHGGHARVHDRADVDVDGVRHDGARLRRPLHFLAAPIAVLQPSGLMFFLKKKTTQKKTIERRGSTDYVDQQRRRLHSNR